MENVYSAGDVVQVFANAYYRSRAEVGEVQGNASRPATIERAMPDAEDYEVTFSDSNEPSSEFVGVDVLMLAADVEAAQAKAAAQQRVRDLAAEMLRQAEQ